MRENAFVEAWKTQHRRVSMILGLTLLCAPSAISVYAENGVNDITVQAVMQTKTVKGTVLDENGEPLIGVSIVVKGTSTGTITDFDGKFSINLPAGSKELVVSYIGYKEQAIIVSGNAPLNIYHARCIKQQIRIVFPEQLPVHYVKLIFHILFQGKLNTMLFRVHFPFRTPEYCRSLSAHA